jgi:hypothetical protein
MTVAIAGAACVATGMMFVPAAVLEDMIGATGLSELVPAAHAPLGDVTRALIAYGIGAGTLGGLTMMFFWQDGRSFRTHHLPEAKRKSWAQIRSDIAAYLSAKMPWAQKADDIRNLADLARFRNTDGHSDTPLRRPLLASQDLPHLGLAEPVLAKIRSPLMRLPVTKAVPDAIAEPTTINLIGQLEAAVAQRQRQLADIEATFQRTTAMMEERIEDSMMSDMNDTTSIGAGGRPVLELLPSASVNDDNADTALAAALATLHRMTANAR